TLVNAPAQVSHALKSTNLLADAKALASEISLTLSIIFAAIIAYIIIQRRAARQSQSESSAPMTEVVDTAPAAAAGALRSRWNEVLKHMDSNRENDWKTAVTDADK